MQIRNVWFNQKIKNRRGSRRYYHPQKKPNLPVTATLTVEISLFQKSLWVYVPSSIYVTYESIRSHWSVSLKIKSWTPDDHMMCLPCQCTSVGQSPCRTPFLCLSCGKTGKWIILNSDTSGKPISGSRRDHRDFTSVCRSPSRGRSSQDRQLEWTPASLHLLAGRFSAGDHDPDAHGDHGQRKTLRPEMWNN